MIDIDCCVVCNSLSLRTLKEHVFKYPGDDVDTHVVDIVYERLWILFRYIAKDTHDLTFRAMLCQSCGLIFTTPRFTEEEIVIKYDTINALGSVKRRLAGDPPVNMEARANRIYGVVSEFVKRTRNTTPTVLDYGGASGYILVPFVKDFRCGILDYERWELPEGVEYWGKDVSDLEQTQRFDVILLLHTLEHVLHPRTLISELASHLSDAGVIYVEVPLGCFKEWRFISEPLTHVNFFSEQSLFKCFELCGLNVLYLTTSYQRVTRGTTWCLNILGSKRKQDNALAYKDALATEQQMSRVRYYLPYAFNPRAIRKVFRKLAGV